MIIIGILICVVFFGLGWLSCAICHAIANGNKIEEEGNDGV